VVKVLVIIRQASDRKENVTSPGINKAVNWRGPNPDSEYRPSKTVITTTLAYRVVFSELTEPFSKQECVPSAD
jgi:hypothetical protein